MIISRKQKELEQRYAQSISPPKEEHCKTERNLKDFKDEVVRGTAKQNQEVLSLTRRIVEKNMKGTFSNASTRLQKELQSELLKEFESNMNTSIKQQRTRRKQQSISLINSNHTSINGQQNALKRLLEHYNIRSLKKKHYEKLINTFGLRIQSVKYEENTPIKKKQPRKNHRLHMPDSNPELKLIDIDLMLIANKIGDDNITASKLDSGRIAKIDNYPSFDKPVTGAKMRRRSLRNNSKAFDKHQMLPLKFSETAKDTFEFRLNKYKQFLFSINFSNQIYRELDRQSYSVSLKYFVGKGNNANLIHSLMQKRFWMERTSNPKEAHFIWTQIKMEEIFSVQQNSTTKESILTGQKTSTTNKRGARQFQPCNPYLKIMTRQTYDQYCEIRKSRMDFEPRVKYSDLKVQDNNLVIVHNHLPKNELLGNKKAMFYCLREFYRLTNRDIFSIVPLTFHIKDKTKDEEFKHFVRHYTERKKNNKQNIWIIKPGEFSNRGNGISCSQQLDQIKKLVSAKESADKTFIIQQYLTRPFLYNRRKFDIRAYMLLTCSNGILKGYWYQQGYIRTSSSYFDLEELADPMIHLTNDAVQKHGEGYGRFEEGNKLSYSQLERYLQSINNKHNFYAQAYPEMRRIATDAIKATALFIDKSKKEHNFEIFGLDFMIDEHFKVWLIQINTNPCLELSCGILQRLIPNMAQNAFRIGLDPVFPPPNIFPSSKKYNVSQNSLFHNRFQLVFDEQREGIQLKTLYSNSRIMETVGVVEEDKEQYQHEGELIEVVE